MDHRASKLGLCFWFSRIFWVLASSGIIVRQLGQFQALHQESEKGKGTYFSYLQSFLTGTTKSSQRASCRVPEWNQIWIHKLIAAKTKIIKWRGDFPTPGCCSLSSQSQWYTNKNWLWLSVSSASHHLQARPRAKAATFFMKNSRVRRNMRANYVLRLQLKVHIWLHSLLPKAGHMLRPDIRPRNQSFSKRDPIKSDLMGKDNSHFYNRATYHGAVRERGDGYSSPLECPYHPLLLFSGTAFCRTKYSTLKRNNFKSTQKLLELSSKSTLWFPMMESQMIMFLSLIQYRKQIYLQLCISQIT